jgi:hypothetical protein
VGPRRVGTDAEVLGQVGVGVAARHANGPRRLTVAR